MTTFLRDYIGDIGTSFLAPWADEPPWRTTSRASEIVRAIMASLPACDFSIEDEAAVHCSAKVEAGAIVKGPAIVGARCFVAAGAYMRDGSWLDERCILGPGAELKSSFMFAGSKLER